MRVHTSLLRRALSSVVPLNMSDKDVAAVVENMCSESGNYSKRLHGQTKIGVFVKDADIVENILLL